MSRLPEEDADRALAALLTLVRDKQILTRDIAAIDLRLPTAPSSGSRMKRRRRAEEANKDKKNKRKGGAA